MEESVYVKRSIVCFIPCCKSKLASGQIEADRKALAGKDLPKTWHLLSKGRNEMYRIANEMENVDIDLSSPKTSAIHLYRGALYRQFSLSKVSREIQENRLRLFIISAWYGIVDAFEPLHEYEAKMQGKIARHWRNHKLDQIICDLLLNLKPPNVFGFFAGSENWSNSGANYRYFFTSGLNEALMDGLEAQLSGCLYRLSGLGPTAILSALGRTFMDFLRSGFNEDFVLNIDRNKRIDGKVVVGFKRGR